jgi:predicted small lipoprotein YifL
MCFEPKSSVAAALHAKGSTLFLGVSLMLLAGCGQKGPLTLPQAAAAVTAPASAPAQ